MSLKKSVTRLGLLATSSFAAAMLASSPALAANECGDPSANGAGADSFTCATPPTYPTGADYTTTSNGDLTLILQNRFDTGTTATGGVRMFGKTGEDMTLIRQDNPAGAGDPRIVNTAGRGVDISTQGDGNIVINLTDGDPASGESTNATTGTAPIRITGSTDAIRADAQGSGAVSVTFATTSPTGPVAVIAGGASGGSGLVVRSTSGAISIDTRGAGFSINATSGGAAIDALSTSGAITITTAAAGGRQRGILAQTGGAGALNVTAGGGVNVNATAGLAAIDLIAGTGGINLTIASGQTTGGAGFAIRAASASAVNVQATMGNISGRVDFSGVTAGGVTFSSAGASLSNGNWLVSGVSIFSGVADTVTLAGANSAHTLAAGAVIGLGGGADAFNLSGIMTASGGSVDLGDGADVFNLTGVLIAHGVTVNFGAGDDTLNLSGVVTKENTASNSTTLDFGAGTDTFNQTGVFIWNGGTLSNLEAFNNSATIYLGGQRIQVGNDKIDDSDGLPDDSLAMSSGVFTGSGDGRVMIDANLGTSGSQVGCASPTVSDCLNFTGAATAGSTRLTINDISLSIDGGTLNTVVTLVEGSTAAEHFILDPASTYYGETSQGAAIRKPVVAYRLVYDATNHRHVLLGAPSDEVFQAGTFAASAQETWRATAGSWLSRQADLRATPGGVEPSAGFWGRIGAQVGERDVAAAYETGGLTLDYDLSHKQRTSHLVFGADVLGAAGQDSQWVLGAMIGYVRSDVEFDATPTEAVATGGTGGLYASYLAGPLFVDAVFNVNILDVTAQAPGMGLGLDVPMAFKLKSLGGQVETGWRVALGAGVFVEPLAGVSYVVTRIHDTEVPGGSGVFDFEDSKSLRIGGGGRLGIDSQLMGMTASYSLTGRYWDDGEGQSDTAITTANGSSALLADDFGGGFSEVMGGVNLFSQDGAVSGFVNLGGKFADGYQSVDGSLGVRVRW